MSSITTEKEWIASRSDCCVEGCFNRPSYVDDMDNVFCDECVEQNMEEEPENWPDYEE